MRVEEAAGVLVAHVGERALGFKVFDEAEHSLLVGTQGNRMRFLCLPQHLPLEGRCLDARSLPGMPSRLDFGEHAVPMEGKLRFRTLLLRHGPCDAALVPIVRSEEHTSELQSLAY